VRPGDTLEFPRTWMPGLVAERVMHEVLMRVTTAPSPQKDVVLS
jgi:hypothetical protein